MKPGYKKEIIQSDSDYTELTDAINNKRANRNMTKITKVSNTKSTQAPKNRTRKCQQKNFFFICLKDKAFTLYVKTVFIKSPNV